MVSFWRENMGAGQTRQTAEMAISKSGAAGHGEPQIDAFNQCLIGPARGRLALAGKNFRLHSLVYVQCEAGFVQGYHIHRNFQRVLAAAENDPTNRADIAVITAPRNRDMTVGRQYIIGGVNINPTCARAKKGNPGMGSIRAGEARFARRRIGFEIATHITGGNSHGSEKADFQMRKILANAPARFHNLVQRRRDGGGFGIKFKIAMDPVGQMEHRFQVWAVPV